MKLCSQTGVTVMILNFRTDRSEQTVPTQIRLLLQERSSLIRVYTVCHSVCIFKTHYPVAEPRSKFYDNYSNFSGIQIFWHFTVCSFLKAQFSLWVQFRFCSIVVKLILAWKPWKSLERIRGRNGRPSRILIMISCQSSRITFKLFNLTFYENIWNEHFVVCVCVVQKNWSFIWLLYNTGDVNKNCECFLHYFM